MMLPFNDAETLFTAVREHEAYMRDGHTTLARETAAKVIDTARRFGSFFVDDNVKTICHPLDALNSMILDAEVDGDEDLAERLRRDKADVELHVARRIIESLRGRTTQIARTLKASLLVGERPKVDAGRTYPSDHVGQIVPMNGKAG